MWVVPVVDPSISCLNQTLKVPVKDNPMFKGLVYKRLKPLFNTLLFLIGPTMQPVGSVAVCQTISV